MSSNQSTLQPAGLFRRLAAIFYDSLLLFALLMIAAGLWLPLTDGEALNSAHPLYPLFQASLLLVALTFFGGFWLVGGQTLGMRAWRVKVRDAHGGPISPKQAVARFFGAILSWLVFGLGFVWVLIDPQKRSWHDLLSSTVLVYEPKQKARKTATDA
jgi:uncharacterized RDD family membrane protein YckC